MNISSKIAVVTGASSGLGAAISKALVEEGATVYGIARNSAALENIQKTLGQNFIPIRLDISNLQAVKEWIKMTFSKQKSPDILINNAGAGSFGKIDEIPSEEWYGMVNTNLNGLYNMSSEIVRFMKIKSTYPHIINIGSILGTTTRADATAYCATKYGVRGFSEALLKELREFNIKVSCINPGSIETEFFKTSGINSHGNMLQPKELATTILHLLKTPDNMLISEMTIRPLNPKAPE
ncbi:MAG TPA: SDR family oxidoreductase [Aequorivita sp.]|nr:SDR family oxidoreductase [Aequorivita sp.]